MSDDRVDEITEEEEERRRLKKRQEIDEFNAELAGVGARNHGRRRDTEDDEDFYFFLMVDDLLAREQRIRLLMNRLDELDRASRRALKEAERRAAEAAERVRRIEEAAAIAPDGRRIYRSEIDPSRAFYEDGTEAASEIIDAIEWTPEMPSWEEQQGAIEAQTQADQDVRDLQDHLERLDRHRERLNGGHLSDRDLQEISLDLEDMPESVRRQLGQSQAGRKSAAREHAPDDSFRSAPDAASAFRRAQAGPEAPSGPESVPAPLSRPAEFRP